jgi:hypothetical protein
MSVTLRSTTLALALAAVGSLAAMPAAEAQSREPLRVIVQKRSYLDPGPVVPVGSMNRYATAHSFSSPVPSIGERHSAGVLPSHIGAGTNPFANSWASPRW